MPRTEEQNEIIRSERINIILTSAMFLFATKGYDNTTLDDIAKDAGCSHGLLYHYFSNKIVLYNFVINKVAFPLVYSMVSKVDFSQKAKFSLRDCLTQFLTFVKSNDDQFAWAVNLLIGVELSIIIGAKSVYLAKEKSKRIFTWVSSCINKGKQEGDFSITKSTKEVTASILCLLKGLAYSRTQLGHKKFICPNVKIIMDMVM